jgi:hypothetical protein
MNDAPEALAAAMVEARFADEDAARSRWLADAIKRDLGRTDEDDSFYPVLCRRGHSAWGVKGTGRHRRRYCLICHRNRMREARETP